METQLQKMLMKIAANTTRGGKAREMAGLVLKGIAANPELAADAAKDSDEMVAYAFRGRRFLTTLPRLATRQLGLDPQQYASHLQDLADAYRADIRMARASFEVIKGDAIEDAYVHEIGGHSCMTGEGAAKYIQLYKLNPEVCSMLVLKSVGMSARALLWTDLDGRRFMDRIYPNSGWHIDCMNDWALMGEVFRRSHNGAPDSCVKFEGFPGAVLVGFVKVSKYWPYMDSMAWVDLRDRNKARLCSQAYDKKRDFIATHFSRSTGGGLNVAERCFFCGRSDGLRQYLRLVDLKRHRFTSTFCCRTCAEGESLLYCGSCGRNFDPTPGESAEVSGRCYRCGTWNVKWIMEETV